MLSRSICPISRHAKHKGIVVKDGVGAAVPVEAFIVDEVYQPLASIFATQYSTEGADFEAFPDTWAQIFAVRDACNVGRGVLLRAAGTQSPTLHANAGVSPVEVFKERPSLNRLKACRRLVRVDQALRVKVWWDRPTRK